MNAIQMLDMVSFLNDRVSSPRFSDASIMQAINSSITSIVEDRLDNIKKAKRYSFEQVQRVRDELYTLIPPTLTIVPMGNTVAYPTTGNGYNYFLKLECVIGGVITLTRPTSYGESGTLEENPFKRPSNVKTYFDQSRSGFVIKRGATGSFTSALLDYVENPDTVTIGKESDKISSGGSVLTVGVIYMVYDQSVHSGVTYEPGQTFTAAATSLTSGVVIPNSVIVSCNLPDKIHQEVCRLASAVMNGSVSDFNKKMDLKNDNQDS